MAEEETKEEADATKMEEAVKEEETSSNKAETADAAETTDEDLAAIEGLKERLRFFFSDANIRQDYFIRRLLTKTDEKSVPVDALLRFNTVKKHTEKPAVLVKAAKELGDLLVVDEEGSTIARAVPFTDEMMDDNIPKSLYLKKLPVKETSYDVGVDELRALFEKYGDVALVKLKFSSGRHDGGKGDSKRTRVPIGAAMVEFHKQDDLEKAAKATLTTKSGEAVDPADKITLAETETRKPAIDLEVMLLSEYVESRKEMKKNDSSDSSKKNKRSEPKDEVEIPKFTFDWKPGCVIRLRGLSEDCDREAILDAVAKGIDLSVEDVKARKIYADFSRGQTDGAIRFPEPSDEIAALSKKLKEGELAVKDVKVEEVSILEGEEEKKYWDEFIEFKNKQAALRHEERSRGKRQKRG